MAEHNDSATTLPARALAQKEYKKGKKKRAKVKKIKEQGSGSENETQKSKQTKWCREIDGPKSTNRPVDEDKINALLEKRSEAKSEKNYTVSDEVTRTLVDMEIVYNDKKREWHTRNLLTDAQKAKKEQEKKRRSENKEAEEPSTKKQKKTKKKE